MDEYYCEKCDKYHSNKYNPHKQYALEEDDNPYDYSMDEVGELDEDIKDEMALWDNVPTEEIERCDPPCYEKPISVEEFNKEIDEMAESEPLAFINGHTMAGIQLEFDEFKKMILTEITKIKEIIDLWSWEIQRLERVTGFARDEDFIAWTKSPLDSGITKFKDGVM